MGYSEIECRLCGVSFNIGRRRLRSEPGWMGWQCTGDIKTAGCQLGKGRNPDVCVDEYSEKDEEEAVEEKVSEDENGREDMEGVYDFEAEVERMLEGEGDEDYLLEESDMEEPLEFQSDGEATDLEEDDDMDIDSDPADALDSLWKGVDLRIKTLPPLAKHNCFRGVGYNGRFISAEEMRGCNTAQCLLSKAHHGAFAEPDDQDYESGGRFCLSGLCDRIRSRDCGGEQLLPARHGVDAPIVDSWDLEDKETAVPFHTACFDIFTRLSRKRFGYVNLEALGNWMFDEPVHNESVENVTSDPNVQESKQQWWYHQDGCEYLAANPLLIPPLTPILRAAIEDDERFDPQNGAFDVPIDTRSSDLFGGLPLELRLQILSYLSSPDIANLRLASRTFRQLPILLWRELLLKEMPYLWEVWSNDVPFIWATTEHEDIVEHQKLEAEINEWRHRTSETIEKEIPEIHNAWVKHMEELLPKRNSNFLDRGRAAALEKMVTGLPASKTNWYKVYTGVTREWKNLKGLKNRKRIWGDIGAIVEMLDKYTEST